MTGALEDRYRQLARAWRLEVPEAARSALRHAVVQRLERPVHSDVWLLLAVMGGRLPEPDEVIDATRAIERDGPERVVRALARRARVLAVGQHVEVVEDLVILDVHHTAQTKLATGIQRVVRRMVDAGGLADRDDVMLVGWTPSLKALRALSAPERENAVHGGVDAPESRGRPYIVIPWRCTYVLPELAIEPERTSRLAALAEFSGNVTGVIGMDCVPVTSGETVGAGMGAAFSRNLCAVAHFDRVAAISEASAGEYRGWKGMLAGTGLEGPDVRAILIAAEAPGGDDSHDERMRAALAPGDDPLVLCVGSHEPRKNHGAVLYAAERLWQEGHRFQLAFVGGNSWNSEGFTQSVERLQRDGRQVVSGKGISDDVLGAAYRHARAVVFPSLNEGFGLPIVEAIAAGTPVLTSDFGSMAEIGAGNGALLVDPRDDEDVVRGLREILVDGPVRDGLLAEIARYAAKDWATYASEVFEYLVPDVHRGDARQEYPDG